LLSFVADASAHGAAPAAIGLLGFNGEDASLVRLSRGMAHRVPDGFRFMCPEAWGGDITAPAVALPGGPALVAGERLFVVAPDGVVSPHPSQPGTGIALANNSAATFGLFSRDAQYELRHITESTSELIRILDEPFRLLAASDSELSLLGWTGSSVVFQTMSLAGEPRERVEWIAPSAVSYAELRVAAEQLYILIWGSAAPWATLGRMTAGAYEPLREANANIAGPVALDTGTLVALDGELEVLEDGAAVDVRGNKVTCLGGVLGQPYACAHGDVLRVEPDGLGSPLFEIVSLREPDYRGLSEAARMDCMTRWLDVKVDVASRAPSSAAAQDAAVPDMVKPTDSAARPAGCALGARARHVWWLEAMLLVVLAARRRSQRG
jgi:PAS domain-containing protein